MTAQDGECVVCVAHTGDRHAEAGISRARLRSRWRQLNYAVYPGVMPVPPGVGADVRGAEGYRQLRMGSGRGVAVAFSDARPAAEDQEATRMPTSPSDGIRSSALPSPATINV